MLGALIWEKDNKLRLSLDRADIWDERKAMDLSKFNFKWVEEQVHKNNYGAVQKLGDEPYDNSPFPTKLPAAALEFDLAKLGKVVANDLDIKTALNTVKFENGTVFNCYINATEQRGYFGFEHLKSTDILPALIVHNYSNGLTEKGDNSHSGAGLQKLGYGKGTVTKTANSIRYHQPTYEGHYFEVLVQWQKMASNKIIGSWTISSDKVANLPVISTAVKEPTGWDKHMAWWKNFWSKSSISVPDQVIQKQYYLEMYKLGSVSRKGAPAITLQAVWTADNGSLPPWKGDFHNDLNTQLSYWPTYTANRFGRRGNIYRLVMENQKPQSRLTPNNILG